MVAKPEVQQFTQAWTKTVNWAKQNKIPYSAYYPVYQLDTQKLISSGSMYSEPERIKAIEAAAGLNYSNALPTDNPSWTDVRGNAVKNATSIFDGLEPTHLIGNIVDTVKRTFAHPSTISNPIGDVLAGNMGAAGRSILTPNDPWTWVPGAADLATVFAADPHLTGGKGAEALAQNPISSVLDILPFGRVASETVGRTAVGDAIASRTGITNAELRKAGLWRVGGKVVKSIPVGKFVKEEHPWLTNLGKDPATGIGIPNLKGGKDAVTGEALPRITIGDFWDLFRTKIGAGSEGADIGENRLIENQEGTKEVARVAAPALSVLSKLNDAQRLALQRLAQVDFRPLEDIMADNRIPQEIRNAYYAADKFNKQMEQIDMQAGRAKKIRSPFNSVDEQGKPINDPNLPPKYETYYVNTDGFRTVTRALEQANADQRAVNQAMHPIAILLLKMDETDRNMTDVFDALGQSSADVFSTIRQSIPAGQVASRAMTALRSTFPSDDRWEEAAVASNAPTLRNMLGLQRYQLADGSWATDALTLHHVNAIRDLFAPGGLIEQMVKAYQEEDWVKLNKVSKAAVRKFNSKTFKNIPRDGRATFSKVRQLTEVTQKYAVDRQKLSEEVIKRTEGKYRGAKMGPAGYKKSMAYLSSKALKSQDAWLKAAIQHPPDIWRNAALDAIANKLSQEEKTAAAMEDTTRILSTQGWKDSELTKLMESPRTMQELMTNEAKSSLENAMLPDIDHAESARVTADAFEQLASLRARGEAPLYVHMLTPREIDNADRSYNVYIRGINMRTPSGLKAATWGYTPTVYDIGVGILQRTKDMVEQDMMQKFIDQELMPRLYDAGEIQSLIRTYFKDEIVGSVDHPSENALTVINRGLEAWNLKSYDPKEIFASSGFTHPDLGKPYYINKDLADAFAQTIQKFQFPAHGIIDRGTKLFRFSILSLSPRYTAHILLGGSFLVALRGNLGMLRFIGPAVYFAMHGSFSEKTLQHFPDEMRPMFDKAATSLHGEATEEGLSAAQYQYARTAMNSWGRNVLIPEKLQGLGLPDTYQNRLVAMANLNTTFTRAVTTAQKAVVYLDGANRALKSNAMFYEDQLIPRSPTTEGGALDDQGRPVHHPITGRVIHDKVRSELPMTPEQAHIQGMEAVAEVVGNLRHMTPLERGTLTKVFPFYGWTKHILKYVMTYPFDHPWRAMILSQIAMQNSQDVASGLPLRIQLLTMLGQPDQFGNVTAIDTKSLNPLRDTANYASLTGLFESFNPAITGTFALVDPQAAFAGQNLYPQATFNSVYGISSAGAGGNLYNAVEQFVPQVTALDEAFNLSGQYAYLSKSNPAQFQKKIFESFGLPFMPEQLNLRQIAAKQEIDRYVQAGAAAKSAAQGNESALAGYGANTAIPDPLNPYYNVTPAYIAAMNQQSEDQTNLPWYSTGVAPPTPPL